MSEDSRRRLVWWLGVPLALVLAAAMVWLVFLRGGSPRSEALVYWYDASDERLFAAPAGTAAGEGVYRAQLFFCGDEPDARFPGVLMRTIDGRDEVSGVETLRWLPANAPAAEMIYEAVQAKCIGRGGARQWYPLDSEG